MYNAKDVRCYDGTMTMDLAGFLQAEVDRTSYRDVEAKTGVSRGSLEKIINHRNTDLPELKTLQRIAAAYEKPLWEVVQMAGVDLDLPRSSGERSQRLEVLMMQVPRLEQLIVRLQALRDTDPEFVDGMIVALEATLNQRHPPNRHLPGEE